MRNMNYSKIYYTDVINGDGLRVSLFVSGCTIHCKGCFNEDAWEFNSGRVFTDFEKDLILDQVFNTKIYYSGISLLGGEPLDNIIGLLPLMEEFRLRNLTDNKNVWIWTGYTLEQIEENPNMKNFLLKYCNKAVIGPFIEEQKDLNLKFRGSKNQKVYTIDKENKTFLADNNY